MFDDLNPLRSWEPKGIVTPANSIVSYRSYSVIRRTVFSRKISFGWQVSAKTGVRLISQVFPHNKILRSQFEKNLQFKQHKKRTLHVFVN